MIQSQQHQSFNPTTFKPFSSKGPIPMQKGVCIVIQNFSKNAKSAKRIKGVKSFVSYLGDDVPNAYDIEIAQFDIYDPGNWKNLGNMSMDS
jgi:hypothetical protein